jgi:hypothetical protein
LRTYGRSAHINARLKMFRNLSGRYRANSAETMPWIARAVNVDLAIAYLEAGCEPLEEGQQTASRGTSPLQSLLEYVEALVRIDERLARIERALGIGPGNE